MNSISWVDKKTNEKVLHVVQAGMEILDTT